MSDDKMKIPPEEKKMLEELSRGVGKLIATAVRNIDNDDLDDLDNDWWNSEKIMYFVRLAGCLRTLISLRSGYVETFEGKRSLTEEDREIIAGYVQRIKGRRN